MPYSITTRDGITIQNIPDDVAPDSPDLKARVAQIRANGASVSLSLVDQIPGEDGLPVPPQPEPPPDPSFGQRVLGALETGTTVVTGATGGLVGTLGGTLKGLAEQILAGNFGTLEANRAVEESAMKGAQALTYAPRTQAGQAMTEAIGGAAQQLVPVTPLTAEMAAVGQAARTAAQMGRTAARTATRGAVDAVRQRAPEVPVAPVAPRAVTEQLQAVERVTKAAKSAGQGSKKAARVLATEAQPDPKVVKSAERLGIQDYLQPDHVTSNEAYRQVVGAIKSNPQSAVALAEKEGLAAVANRASTLIDEIGGTNDMSALDAGVKAKMRDTHAALLASEDAVYATLRESIPAQVDAPAPSVLAFIERRAQDLRGAGNLTPLEKSVRAKLSPRKDGTEPSYALLDDVRKEVGAATRQQGAFRDADSALAKQLYREILKDQEEVAAASGVGDMFNTARSATSVRKALEDDLAALFGKDLDRSLLSSGDRSLPGAIRAAASGDSARLARLISAVPQDLRQQVVASGISTVLRRAATRGEMDFTGYAKWWAGLQRNRQAYAAVMSNLPLSARKQLTALARVSQGISDSLATRTKTGALNTIKAEMMGADSLMESLYSLAKRSAAGAASEVVTTPLGLPGAGLSAGLASALTKGKPKAMQAVDSLIASPEFSQLVKTQAGTAARSEATRRLATSRPFVQALKASGRSLSLTEREILIAEAMQAGQLQDERRAQAIAP
jgi:hypothetical protein